jgi:hypothetical protein
MLQPRFYNSIKPTGMTANAGEEMKS